MSGLREGSAFILTEIKISKTGAGAPAFWNAKT